VSAVDWMLLHWLTHRHIFVDKYLRMRVFLHRQCKYENDIEKRCPS